MSKPWRIRAHKKKQTADEIFEVFDMWKHNEQELHTSIRRIDLSQFFFLCKPRRQVYSCCGVYLRRHRSALWIKQLAWSIVSWTDIIKFSLAKQHLSMYTINAIPLEKGLHSCRLGSEISLVRYANLFDFWYATTRVCKHATPSLSRKYCIYVFGKGFYSNNNENEKEN